MKVKIVLDLADCPERPRKIAAAETDAERRTLILLAFDAECIKWQYEIVKEAGDEP